MTLELRDELIRRVQELPHFVSTRGMNFFFFFTSRSLPVLRSFLERKKIRNSQFYTRALQVRAL